MELECITLLSDDKSTELISHHQLEELRKSQKETPHVRASLVAQLVKNLPAMQETRVRALGWEDHLEKVKWQSTPVLLPGKSHGQRSLVGYSLP